MVSTLQRVYYQLFPHEHHAEWGRGVNDWHHLDGQVSLHFQDAPTLFISWGAGPIQYSVECCPRSLFNEEILVEVAMSLHDYWRPLIGKAVTCTYLDGDHQVLEFGCDEYRLFMSYQYEDGTFGGDCLRIRPKVPDEYSSALLTR